MPSIDNYIGIVDLSTEYKVSMCIIAVNFFISLWLFNKVTTILLHRCDQPFVIEINSCNLYCTYSFCVTSMIDICINDYTTDGFKLTQTKSSTLSRFWPHPYVSRLTRCSLPTRNCIAAVCQPIKHLCFIKQPRGYRPSKALQYGRWRSRRAAVLLGCLPVGDNCTCLLELYLRFNKDLVGTY